MTSKGRADLSERYERFREDEARWSGYMRDAQEDDHTVFDSLLREILPKPACHDPLQAAKTNATMSAG